MRNYLLRRWDNTAKPESKRIDVQCINGTGRLRQWLEHIFDGKTTLRDSFVHYKADLLKYSGGQLLQPNSYGTVAGVHLHAEHLALSETPPTVSAAALAVQRVALGVHPSIVDIDMVRRQFPSSAWRTANTDSDRFTPVGRPIVCFFVDRITEPFVSHLSELTTNVIRRHDLKVVQQLKKQIGFRSAATATAYLLFADVRHIHTGGAISTALLHGSGSDRWRDCNTHMVLRLHVAGDVPMRLLPDNKLVVSKNCRYTLIGIQTATFEQHPEVDARFSTNTHRPLIVFFDMAVRIDR